MADAGYLSRKNCDIVVEKNGKPFFSMKRNTMVKAGGSRAWKRMVQLATMRKEIYDAVYHTRSVIEAVNSAIKIGVREQCAHHQDKGKEHHDCAAHPRVQHQATALRQDCKEPWVSILDKVRPVTTVSGHSNVVDTLLHGRATGFYHSWMLSRWYKVPNTPSMAQNFRFLDIESENR
jgi:hypothetical protein